MTDPLPVSDDQMVTLVERMDRVAIDTLMKIAEDPDKPDTVRMQAFDKASAWLKDRARIVAKQPGAGEGVPGIEQMQALIRQEVAKTVKPNKTVAARKAAKAQAKARGDGIDRSGSSAKLQEMIDQLAQQG